MSIIRRKQAIHNLVIRMDVEEDAVVLKTFHEDESGDRIEDEKESSYRYRYKNDEGRKENIKNCIMLIADLRQADKNGKGHLYIPKNASELRHYVKNRTLIINNLYLTDRDRKELIKEYTDADLPSKAVLSEDGLDIPFNIPADEDDDDEEDEKGNDIEKERKNIEPGLAKQMEFVREEKRERHRKKHQHDREKSEYTKTF